MYTRRKAMYIQLIAIINNGRNSDVPAGFRVIDADNTKDIKDIPYNVMYNVIASNKAKVAGIELDKKAGKLKGSNGTFDRYASIVNGCIVKNAVVVLKTIDDLGYVLSDGQGKVLELSIKDTIRASEGIGIANGKVVERGNEKFISAITGTYPNRNAKGTQVYKKKQLEAQDKEYAKQIKKAVETKTAPSTQTVKKVGNKNIVVDRRTDYRMPQIIIGTNANPSRQNEIDEKTGMTITQKLTYTILAIKEVRPFYASVLNLLKKVEANSIDGVDTMAVTINTLYFSAEFVKEMTLPELMFIMLHEVSHVAMKHRAREDKREHDAWNIACDYYINKNLAEEFGLKEPGDVVIANSKAYGPPDTKYRIALPTIGLYNANINVNTDTPEKLYEELMESQKQQEQQNQQQQQNQQNQQNQQGQNQEQEEDQQGQGQGNNQQEQNNQDQNQGQNGQDSSECQDGQDEQDEKGNGQGDSSEEQNGEQNNQGQGSQSQNNQSQNENEQGQGQGQQNQQGQSGQHGQQSQDQQSQDEQQGQGGQQSQNGNRNNNDTKYNDSVDEESTKGKSDQNVKSSQLKNSENNDGTTDESSDGDETGNGESQFSNEQRQQGRFEGKEFRGQRIKNSKPDMVDTNETAGMSTEQLKQEQGVLLGQAHSIYMQECGNKPGGDSAGFLERYVEEALAPKVNWRSTVRKYLIEFDKSQHEYTLRHPDKRFATRVDANGDRQVFAGPHISPTGALGSIKICVDTSGSISPEDIGIALAQIKALFKQYNARAELLYWDTRIRAVYPFKDIKDLLDKKPMGGGGTDANCIFDYFETNKDYKLRKKEKPSLIIVFTDGYFGDIDKRYYKKYKSTIWVIKGEYKFKAPFGTIAPFKIDD